MSEAAELTDLHVSTPVVLRFLTHVFDLPIWQKAVLIIAGALGVAGIGGKLSESTAASKTQQVQSSAPNASDRSIHDSHSFVSNSPDASPASPSAGTSPDTTAPPSALQTLLAEHGGWMRHVGITFVAAFVVGWIFRAFVRMMTTLATVAAAIFFGLSYFGVTNVDLTAAHQKYDDTMQWVNAQSVKAKDALIAHIPASGSTAGGFVMGFRRRRR